MKKLKKVFFELIKIIKEGENKWIPASLAYSFIVSFIPIVFAFAMIAIKYFVDGEQVKELLNQNGESLPFITDIIDNVQNNFTGTGIFLTILLVGYSINMASSGIKSIIVANDEFYEFEKKSGIYNTIASIVVVIILLISMLAAILVIGFIPEVLSFFKLDFLLPYTYFIIIPIMFLVLCVIFKLTSGMRLKFKSIWLGALVSALGIFLLVTFSSLIIKAGGMASDIFGSLITILLFAHFLYYISLCIYYGLATNVALYRVDKTLKREEIIYENTIYGK